MDSTNEFSFVLKPSEHGVGVFAAHAIHANTLLRLFREEDKTPVSIQRNKEDVPELFRHYCLTDNNDDNKLICPVDFGRLEIGWYLNHSHKPNAYHRDYDYYALKEIKEGEEVTIDYNSFEEPENIKASYYKK